MAKKERVSPSQREHMEGRLAEVERYRSRPVATADVERILTGMQSGDEITRANAVREICPCRMSWEVFDRLRKAARPLRKDPSPLVRFNALHIEEDAKHIASLEALSERLQEWEEREEETRPRPDQRGRQRRSK
jgi:hypothetical protein